MKKHLLCGGLVVTLAAFFVSPAFAMTLSDLETEVRIATYDTATETTRRAQSDTVIDNLLNEAMREVVSVTWCLETSTAITLVANTTFYALPTNFINVSMDGGVRYENASGNTKILAQVTRRKIYQDTPDWQDKTGAPMQYFLHQDSDADPLDIAVYPIPTATSTGTVTVQYYFQPTSMSSDSDVPFDGFRHLYPYHMALAYKVSAQLLLTMGFAEKSTSYYNLYLGTVKMMSDRLGQMPDYNPTGRAYAPANNR